MFAFSAKDNSMVSCQKGPTRHAYAWRRGPFLQDTLELHAQHLTPTHTPTPTTPDSIHKLSHL